MKILICNEHHGATRAVVLKGWMRAALGFCLLGLPVILGYYGYQLADARTSRLAKDEASQAMAAGVLAFPGYKDDFGNMVQLAHGNGFETRYAHARTTQVKVWDVVKKGQLIALSGTSGRATGPHVHFEEHKNGRVVDPASYIHSTIR